MLVTSQMSTSEKKGGGGGKEKGGESPATSLRGSEQRASSYRDISFLLPSFLPLPLLPTRLPPLLPMGFASNGGGRRRALPIGIAKHCGALCCGTEYATAKSAIAFRITSICACREHNKVQRGFGGLGGNKISATNRRGTTFPPCLEYSGFCP